MIKYKKRKTGGGKRTPNKIDVFDLFIEWISMTTSERKAIGVETHGDFAKKYNIRQPTLSDWKLRADFNERKKQLQVAKMQDSTADVLDGLRKRCVKYGMAYDVELFLLYAEGWDRKHTLEILGEIKLGSNDIRSIIDLLPKEKQKSFYDTLTNLIAEAESNRAIGAA